MLAEVAGPDQRAAKKMGPGHCTKKIYPGSPGVTFLDTPLPIHHLPKATLPCWKILDRRQLFFLANHNSPEQTPYTCLNFAIIFSREGHAKKYKNIYLISILLIRFIYSIHIIQVFSFVCVLTWPLLGIKKKLGQRPDRSPLGV